MVYDGLEYKGNNLFDNNDPILVYERYSMKVLVRNVPKNQHKIACLKVDVLEKTPSEQPLCSLCEEHERLWLAFVNNYGFFLFRKCHGRPKSLWTKMVAVAKITEHPLFRAAFSGVSSLKSINLYLEREETEFSLRLAVYIPSQLVALNLESLLQCPPRRVIDAHDLTFLLRIFNLIHEQNNYCGSHAHDSTTGYCQPMVRRAECTQSSHTIQDFFDNVRNEIPHVKEYALRTEKLTARLRPYQRDAARFMIDRELRPNLRFNFSWFYYHIKIETDTIPLYYLPNLAFFLKSPPTVPALSLCGGILADEMGLGKTVELLALITTVTPNHTPEVVKIHGESTKSGCTMNEIREVVDDLISNVVASIEGEKAVIQFKNDKRTSDSRALYYSSSSFMPSSPSKKSIIRCEECGTSCVQQRVHWSPGLSAQTRFVCPECIMATDEFIPVKATLIVVPRVIAHQWYEEIRKHVKEEVKIDVYKGVLIDGYKHPHYLNQFDIVITTYDVITREKSFLQVRNPIDRLRKRPYETGKIASTPLFSVLWWRVCLDESQMVDRESSTISSLCKGLQARARWSITGTPISASIKDLYGLVNFLGVNPLDKEWIFDQCLYRPYITMKNSLPLASFMARIMWRTEKKHLQAKMSRVNSHVEMVTLSPMEERMYSDLLTRSKENVLGVVRTLSLDTKLSTSRSLQSKLLCSLARVSLFLLTSLSGGQRLRRRNGDANVQFDEDQGMHFNRMFTPTSLFSRLLREKKKGVTRGQREALMHWNGVAALLWHSGLPAEAFRYYNEALQLILRSGSLNEYLGHGNSVVFTSKEMVEEGEEEEEKEGRLGGPLSADSLQFVHIYRNVQWLMAEVPELAGTSEIDMEAITPLFHRAWRTYSRNEESVYKEKELEWEKVKNEVKEHNGKSLKLMKWIDKLTVAADELVKSEGQDFRNFNLNLEKRLGISIVNVRSMRGWIMDQLEGMKGFSENLVELIDRCIEVSNEEDLDDEVNEGRYRMSDLPEVIKSPKKNQKEEKEEEDGEDKEIGQRMRGIKKTIVELGRIEIVDKKGDDLMIIMKNDLKDLFDGCVNCNRDGEFDDESQKVCLFCATQALHQRMQLKDHRGKPSRTIASVLESIEKELSHMIYRHKVVNKDEEGEWKELQKSWKETVTAWHSLDTYWRAVLIVMLEKMNRIRELRQCTIRSEKEERLEDEKKKLQRARVLLEKAEHNLRYVYSLREESGVTPSTSSDTSSYPSSRECPICFDEIGDSWFVFPCAHLNCGKCFNRLIKVQGANRITCSVCRGVCSQLAVMYVSNKKKSSDHSLVDSLNLNVKLDKILRLVVSILQHNHHDKMIVFTSFHLGWTVLKSVFTRANLPFVALSSDSQHNAVALSKFRNDPSTRILLMKYESGGKGLNLTTANHIIFSDIVDDPSLEKQAIGRCDRIGQKKTVELHYIIAKDTVDERMYNLTREVTSTEYMHDDNWTVGTLIDLFTEM
ncbi:hypothetical protein PMAYCL1PPCAC_06910 [Pristionchus mayeri]|uniref:RING-type domain-containing protein n=1 Tax=Pristionchus mayeri TaxID=1317129 RepID=A0AAN4ZFH4_9BILA|nr:hypothetical protein PMAYCL1PPCAC_06910 [Pristionchus mayeri]